MKGHEFESKLNFKLIGWVWGLCKLQREVFVSDGERIPELTSVPTSQSKKKTIIHRHQIRADKRVLSQQWNQIRPNLKVILGGFLRGSVVKNPPANVGDADSIPSPGRSHMLQSN